VTESQLGCCQPFNYFFGNALRHQLLVVLLSLMSHLFSKHSSTKENWDTNKNALVLLALFGAIRKHRGGFPYGS